MWPALVAVGLGGCLAVRWMRAHAWTVNARLAKRQFHRSGFFISSAIDTCLAPGTYATVLAFARLQAMPPVQDSGYTAHSDATYQLWKLRADCQGNEERSNAISMREQPGAVVPPPLALLVRDILQYLPEADYNINVVLYDDVAQVVSRDYGELLARSERTIKDHHFASLTWHQDKTTRWNNNFLFFLVLDCSGCTSDKNLLRIGRMAKSSLHEPEWPATFRASERADVEVLAEVRGDARSGYLIDEDFQTSDGCVNVHSRSHLRFSLANFQNRPDLVRAHYGRDVVLTAANDVNSRRFSVTRLKLIVRFLRKEL